MKRFTLLAALVAALHVTPAVSGGGRNAETWDRPGVGVPVRFQSENGGAFRPRVLIVQTDTGLLHADLPATSDSVQSEDRVDLSGLPLLGSLFRQRVAPEDASKGVPVGMLFRDGDTLFLEASGWMQRLSSLPVVLSTYVPQLGSVSYGLGPLDYRTSSDAVPGLDVPVGRAFLIDGKLFLASQGNAVQGLESVVLERF